MAVRAGAGQSGAVMMGGHEDRGWARLNIEPINSSLTTYNPDPISCTPKVCFEMAINYNNDIIVTKNSSKKAMECLENFVIKVNVMFWCNGCVASINLNLNSVFKILIRCNYCSLAGGGVLAVLATLHCPLAKVFSLLSFLPLFLCSSFHATESLSAGCWVSPAVPGSECLIGIGLNWQWLVSSARRATF